MGVTVAAVTTVTRVARKTSFATRTPAPANSAENAQQTARAGVAASTAYPAATTVSAVTTGTAVRAGNGGVRTADTGSTCSAGTPGSTGTAVAANSKEPGSRTSVAADAASAAPTAIAAVLTRQKPVGAFEAIATCSTVAAVTGAVPDCEETGVATGPSVTADAPGDDGRTSITACTAAAEQQTAPPAVSAIAGDGPDAAVATGTTVGEKRERACTPATPSGAAKSESRAGTADTAAAATTGQGEESRIAAVSPLAAVTAGERISPGSAVAAVSEEQSARAAVAARAALRPGPPIAASSEPARCSAIATVEARASIADQTTASTVTGTTGAGPFVAGVAVARADQKTGVGVVGCSISDENPDEVGDRVRAHLHRGRCGGGLTGRTAARDGIRQLPRAEAFVGLTTNKRQCSPQQAPGARATGVASGSEPGQQGPTQSVDRVTPLRLGDNRRFRLRGCSDDGATGGRTLQRRDLFDRPQRRCRRSGLPGAGAGKCGSDSRNRIARGIGCG
ncbi:MAG: hypothetical protein KDB47_16430 [Mycobacterium sp.]|nr:hypothetical protein [Mycobacterium sp.]